MEDRSVSRDSSVARTPVKVAENPRGSQTKSLRKTLFRFSVNQNSGLRTGQPFAVSFHRLSSRQRQLMTTICPSPLAATNAADTSNRQFAQLTALENGQQSAIGFEDGTEAQSPARIRAFDEVSRDDSLSHRPDAVIDIAPTTEARRADTLTFGRRPAVAERRPLFVAKHQPVTTTLLAKSRFMQVFEELSAESQSQLIKGLDWLARNAVRVE